VRCFVAVDVAPEVRAAIVRAQTALRAAAPHADVRWTAPAAFHVTLKFLGAVADGRVPAVIAAVGPAIAGAEPLALAAGGLGAFPSRARARVVWAGIAVGGESVAALASAIDTALAPLGFPVEARPFHAHLTIGRVRSPRGARELAAALEDRARDSFGAWTAAEVVLYESRLRPTGAEYTRVADWRLGNEG
jgi:RNA 2',3'-cyclic 3'-phosphodiesterase